MVLVGNTGYSASFKRCQKNFYHAFNRSFAEHAEHSAAPKGRLGTGCMQPAVADDKGDLGSDGGNAGEKVRADRQLHYLLSYGHRVVYDVRAYGTFP